MAGGGFSKKYQVSDALEDIIGKSKATRAECVKLVWKYIKENDLRDPEERKIILMDDALKAVYGRKAKLKTTEVVKFGDHLS